MSFARAGRVDAELAGTSATAGQAHNAMAGVAALLTGGHEPEPDADQPHEPDEPDADRPEDDQPAVADADAADEPGDGQPGGDQPGAAAAGGGGSIAGQSFTAKSGAGERLECRVVGVPV